MGRAGADAGAALGALSVPVDAALVRDWIGEFAGSVAAEKERLTALDAAIGDADHGANLARGLAAVQGKLAADDAPDTPGKLLMLVGRTLISTVGGASGPLYGTVFRELGKAMGDEASVDDATFAAGLEAGLEGVRRLGGAAEGDKTLVDAYAPALAAFEGGRPLAEAAKAAAQAADEGAKATVPLEARKGRASYLGPRSVGHQDPGATSTALLFAALAKVA